MRARIVVRAVLRTARSGSGANAELFSVSARALTVQEKKSKCSRFDTIQSAISDDANRQCGEYRFECRGGELTLSAAANALLLNNSQREY